MNEAFTEVIALLKQKDEFHNQAMGEAEAIVKELQEALRVSQVSSELGNRAPNSPMVRRICRMGTEFVDRAPNSANPHRIRRTSTDFCG